MNFVAVILDRIFSITFSITFMILVSKMLFSPLSNTLSGSCIIALIILYVPIFESSSMQAALGTYILGMKIINEDGTRISFLKSLIRFIILGLINSTVILGIISIICMICTDEKKFLHDMIFDTRMVKRAS